MIIPKGMVTSSTVISFLCDWDVHDDQSVFIFNGNTRHFFRIERCSEVGNINIEGVSDFE